MYTYEEALNNSIKYFNGNELSAKVFLDKYALRDVENNILEDTPELMHRRLAKEFARIEKDKFEKPLSEEKIYNLFKDFAHIIPQGSPCFAIGNNYQIASASNCFVLESPEDSYGGICKTDEELVQLSKRRGGVGLDLSKLRPKGNRTNNSSRTSTGIKSWMQRYSNSIREVGQSGRRGALMLTVNVHHPDIVDFIIAKNNNTDVTGANISVRLTDEFLKAVENNEEYELRFPIDSTNVIKKVKAKEIWDLIIDNAWSRAEPGVLFWDNILNESIPDCYDDYKSISTNPCQPSWAKVLTKNGIREFKNLEIGEEIWSKDGWTKIIKRWSTGLNKVYKYSTTAGIFYGTENHKLVSFGKKVQAKECDSIDIFTGPEVNNVVLNEQDIIDGLVIGDGYTHKASNNLVVLGIGQDDYDYFDSEIKNYITKHRPGISETAYEIKTTIQPEELPVLPTRIIPERFLNKDKICGFLRGLYSANGSICDNRITLKSSCLELIEQVQLMLNSIGIQSYYTTNKAKNVRFSNGDYLCKQSYDLNITSDREKFVNSIGFIQEYKNEKIKIKNYTKSKKTFEIISKEFISEEETFDITVDNISHTYWTQGCNVSNCGEIILSANDSCRLLVINLMNFVKYPFQSNAYFDFFEFYESAQIAQRLMDDVVDLELEKIDSIINKIKQDPEDIILKRTELALWENIRVACENGRRTGLGITALGDAIAACNIKYGSDKSIEFTERVYKTLKFGSYRSSVDMAKELGAFPIWNWKEEKNNQFLLRIKDESVVLDSKPGTMKDTFALFSGKDLYNDMAKYGRRNIANLTTAPVGSMSILASYIVNGERMFNTTSGIEPLYSWKPFTKRKKGNPGDDKFRSDFVDQSGDHWMEFDVYHSGITAYLKHNQGFTVEDSPYYGASAEEIVWTQRVKLQAAAQKHVDHSISSTVNLPENVSKEEVDKIYREAWKSGCKGITVYRDNCRTGVLIKKEEKVKLTNAEKRPKSLPCDIYNISVSNNKYTVVVGLLNNHPYEVFCVANFIDKHKRGELVKAGKGKYVVKTSDADLELSEYLEDDTQNALLRMVSTSLRHGASIKFVIEQLQKTKGDLTSFTKCVARALKKYIQDGDNSSEKCECGNQLIYQEGCLTCKSCGYSKCN